jgi:hypothetical protein
MSRPVVIIIFCLVGYFMYSKVQHRPTESLIPNAESLVPYGEPLVPYGAAGDRTDLGPKEIQLRGVFNAADHVVPGHPTVFVFCTSYCPSCKRLQGRDFGVFLPLRPDVAIRHVRLRKGWNHDSVRAQYGLNFGFTPHIIVYGPDGRLIAQDDGQDRSGRKFLNKWMKDEFDRKWRRG